MDGETPPPRPKKLRLTTGTLMIWVAVVAVLLSLVQGDTVDWLPKGAIGWLSGVVCVAIVVVIPWLEYHWSRSPDSLQPTSERGKHVVNLLAIGLLFCMASAVLLLGMLFVLILAV